MVLKFLHLFRTIMNNVSPLTLEDAEAEPVLLHKPHLL